VRFRRLEIRLFASLGTGRDFIAHAGVESQVLLQPDIILEVDPKHGLPHSKLGWSDRTIP